MFTAQKKGQLFLAGLLLCMIVFIVIAIVNGAYQNSPGTAVDYDNIANYAGKKVTLQGTFGKI